jgi:hypothetical protein
LARAIVPADQLETALTDLRDRWRPATVVVGDGTRSRPVAQAAAALIGAGRVVVRDEHGTTLLARARYWREHPPRGVWRLVPTTLRVPPEPFDDLVAVILAERFLAELADSSDTGYVGAKESPQ